MTEFTNLALVEVVSISSGALFAALCFVMHRLGHRSYWLRRARNRHRVRLMRAAADALLPAHRAPIGSGWCENRGDLWAGIRIVPRATVALPCRSAGRPGHTGATRAPGEGR